MWAATYDDFEFKKCYNLQDADILSVSRNFAILILFNDVITTW